MPWSRLADIRENRSQTGWMRLMPSAVMRTRLALACRPDPGSGSATSTGWLDTEDGQTYVQTAAAAGRNGQLLYDIAQNNPNQYTNPRLVRFGLRTNF